MGIWQVRYTGDLAGIAYWGLASTVYWGSGKVYGDLEDTVQYIGDLAGTVYWGSGRYIGDLAGTVYWGSGRYSIFGNWQCILGTWQVQYFVYLT